MQDISGYGISASVAASNTFPSGFPVTQFADDADPVDAASIQLADKAMGVNGDLIVWSKANPILVVIAVIPGSDDDRNLSVLAEANRTAKGKAPARDVINMVITYPDGSTASLSQGKITDAIPTQAIASAGRMKSKPYGFVFEGMNKTGAA